jgi:hypothetical protein
MSVRSSPWGAEVQWLDELAAAQLILDPEVAQCWPLIRDGIQLNKLNRPSLGTVISLLRANSGIGLDEISIEVDPENPERTLVIQLDDERTCSTSSLIRELERLLATAEKERATDGAR